jgi:hypothetical protein
MSVSPSLQSGVGLYVGSLRSVLRTAPTSRHYYPSRSASCCTDEICVQVSLELLF